MCNALEELVNEGFQKGRQEGVQEGIQKGIQAIVRTCKRLNLDEKSTVNNVMQEFHVSGGRSYGICEKILVQLSRM